MLTIVILVIVAILLYSNWKFRNRMTYYSVMVDIIIEDVKQSPNLENLLSLSSAYIKIQHYKDALEILLQLEVLQIIKNEDIPKNKRDIIEMNKEFCTNPVPGVNTPKNFDKSYWHNFYLVRLGKKRYIYISEEYYIATNSKLRNC